MTLIAGIRGVGKSFIAADSRQTIVLADGEEEILDDAQKWQQLGRYSMTAVAGDALLAAFIIRKLADLVGNTPSYTEVKEAFDANLELLAREYLIGRSRADTHCAILLSGYEKSKKDLLDAGRLGDVLAAGVKKRGEGVTVEQNIDRSILEGMSTAMHSAAKHGKTIQNGSMVSINSPLSELTGYQVTFDDGNVFIDMKEVDNFDAIFYGADSQFNIIKVPDEVLSEIYFRNIDGMDEEAIVKSDAMWIVAFMTEIIRERKYKHVGGNIFPIMIAPAGGSFYGGPISQQDRRTGELKVVRDSEIVDGVLCYTGLDGKPTAYQTLFDLADGKSSQFRITI